MSTTGMNKRTMNSLDAAFGAFMKKDYKKAKTSLQKLSINDSLEKWQKAKIDQFLAICNRKTEDASKLKDGETLAPSFASISVLINEKCYEQAVSMMDSIELDKGSVYYLKAEMAIEQGLVDEAVTLLNEAIDVDPRNKGYAMHSPSFQEHLQDEEFSFLVETAE